MNRRQELSLVLNHIKKYPKVDASAIAEFCKKNGWEIHDFSGAIYELLSSLVTEGESKRFNGAYAQDQLSMGTIVEMEHTTCAQLAEKIAKDHLAEIPDYYTRLQSMEDAAKRRSRVVHTDEGTSISATEIAIGMLM